MKPTSRPAWLQTLVTVLLTGIASGVGLGLGDAIQLRRVSPIGAWAGALAAPLVLVLVVGLWRSGRTSASWFVAVSVAVYLAAGFLAGAFRFESWPPAVPIMVLSPLVYPIAGLVWAGLLQQAAAQGYLPFLDQPSR